MNEWWTCLSDQLRVRVDLAKQTPQDLAAVYLAIKDLRESCASVGEIVGSMTVLLAEAPEHVALRAGHELYSLLSDDSIDTSTSVSALLHGTRRSELIDAFRKLLTMPPHDQRRVYVELILAALGDDPVGRNRRIVLEYQRGNQSFMSIVRISSIGGPLARRALREIFEQTKDDMLKFYAAAYLLRHNDTIGLGFIEEFGQSDPRMGKLGWAVDLPTSGNAESLKLSLMVLDTVRDPGVASRLLEFSERLIEMNAAYAVYLLPVQDKLRGMLNTLERRE